MISIVLVLPYQRKQEGNTDGRRLAGLHFEVYLLSLQSEKEVAGFHWRHATLSSGRQQLLLNAGFSSHVWRSDGQAHEVLGILLGTWNTHGSLEYFLVRYLEDPHSVYSPAMNLLCTLFWTSLMSFRLAAF